MEMDLENRLVSTEYLPEDDGDNPLRPRTLREYIGQEKVKENLSAGSTGSRVAVRSSRFGQDHVGGYYRQRVGCQFPYHLRSGLGASR